jgi:putative ATP-dependent endonuclease of the OLD family
VKPKAYRSEFRTRFCEAVLARRVLIVEGRTEYDALPAAARRLRELHPTEFRTLETLGIAVVDAHTDSQVGPLGTYFNSLGKQVFAVFDRQTPATKQAIEAIMPNSFEVPGHVFEELLLDQCAEVALRRYALQIVEDGDWPPHLTSKTPVATTSLAELKAALHDYLKWGKGSGGAAELIGSCSRDEMPAFVVETLRSIQRIAEPVPSTPAATEADR